MGKQSPVASREITEVINGCIAKVNCTMALLMFVGSAIVFGAAFVSGSSLIMIAGLTLMTPALTAMIVCAIIARQVRGFATQLEEVDKIKMSGTE